MRFRALHRSAVMGAAAVTAFALVSCTTPEPSEDVPTTLRIAVEATDVNFDPILTGSRLVVAGPLAATHDPLVAWDRSSSTMDPWLLEEFEVSDDGYTMTMKLREDVNFVDGVHFDAEALKTYFDYALENPDSAVSVLISPYKPKLEVTGEYTAELTTEQPMRFDFFYLMEEIPVISPAAADNPGVAIEEPMGSGPYMIEEIVPDVSVKVVRNPDYWNPDAFPFDEIEFIVFSDRVAALNALKSGQLDATELTLPLAQEAEDAGFVLHEGTGSFPTLYFQDRDGSVLAPLGDLRVRQAINMAFDKVEIAETLDLGFGKVSSQPFTAGQAEYVEGADDFYTYDPERAKELLAEAGYPDGFDMTILSGGASASFFTRTDSFEPIIQQSLADIGINVTFHQEIDAGEWVAAIQSGSYPVLALPHIYTNVLRFLDPSAGGGNALLIRGGSDPSIQDILDGINFGNAEESAAASQEFGQYMLDNAWFAPFSKPPTIWATIEGVEIEVGDILGIPNLREFQLSD